MWSKSAVAAAALVGCSLSVSLAHAEPAPAPPPAPETTIDGDGTYAVGADIAPGTYTSAGPIGDTACYWKRADGTGTVDNALSKQPQVVQIAPTDTEFKTSQCQPWRLTACPPDCPPAPANPWDILGQVGRFLGPH